MRLNRFRINTPKGITPDFINNAPDTMKNNPLHGDIKYVTIALNVFEHFTVSDNGTVACIIITITQATIRIISNQDARVDFTETV